MTLYYELDYCAWTIARPNGFGFGFERSTYELDYCAWTIARPNGIGFGFERST